MHMGRDGGTKFPPTLRTVLLGGAPVTASFLRRLQARLDPSTRVVALYGMTEAGPVCVATAGEKLAFRGEGDYVGAPLGKVSVDVLDPDPSGVGEVVVSGPSLFTGYLGEEERSGDAPFPTGDLGRKTGDGGRENLVLMGRRKDMIIRRGVNIYPASFEAQLAALSDASGRPLVRACAMVGVWNASRQDEDVVLFVSPFDSSTFDARQFEGKAAEICGRDVQPDHVRVVDEIPVTGRLDKTDKRALRRLVEERAAAAPLAGPLVPFHWRRFVRKQLLQGRQLGLKAALPATAFRLGLLGLLQAGWAADYVTGQRGQADFAGPLFIIGHQRSGTTLLHRLLALDRNSRVLKLHEMFLPATSIQRGLGAAASLDNVLGGHVGRWFEKLQDRKLGPMDQVHRIRFDEVEEDEFVLWTVYASAMCVNDSPVSTGDTALDEMRDFDRWDPAEQEQALNWYRACVTKKVQRQPTADGSPPLVVSKNPAFSQKIPYLVRTFPDARFVYLVRNPLRTIPSRLSLIREIWRHRFPGFTEMNEEQVETILQDSFNTYRFAERDLVEVPRGKRLVFTYDEFSSAPSRALSQLYRHFKLPGPPPELEAELSRLDESQPDRTSGHRYSLADFGLAEDRIREALPSVFEKYGFE